MLIIDISKKVYKELKRDNLGEYHDLYVQSDTLLLIDVFENFRNICIEIYELGPAYFLAVPGLAWEACLKKTEIELEFLTDIDTLLTVEKELEEEYVMQYIDTQKQIIYTKKIMLETYLIYLDVNTLYGWTMSQKLPLDGFKWKKILLDLMKTS